MKLLRQIASGVLLSLSMLFLMVAALAPFDESEPPEERRDMVLGGLMLGVPMMLGGGWLLWGLQRDWREEEGDRLRQLFFQTVQFSNGAIQQWLLQRHAVCNGGKFDGRRGQALSRRAS